MNITHAIATNRRREKYKRLVNAIRLRIFDYEDIGKRYKAERVLSKLTRFIRRHKR